MEYCQRCGQPAPRRIPAGDSRPRSVCSACGHIHYENPRLVVGCIVLQDDALLLCRRAIEPRRGLWTLPAGFLEQGESTAVGAVRETLEEACAQVEVVAPYAYWDIPGISQVYVFFRARMVRPGYGPSPESSEVMLCPLSAIPWDELAFTAVRLTLQQLVHEHAQGHYGVHHGTLEGDPASGFALAPQRWSGRYQLVQPPSTGSRTPVT